MKIQTEKELKELTKKTTGPIIVLSNGSVFIHTDKGLELARRYMKKFNLIMYFFNHKAKKATKKTPQ